MEFPTECLRIIREFVYGIYFTEKLPNNELSTGYTAKPYPSTQSVDKAKSYTQSITLFHGINRVYYSNGKIKNIFEYEWGAIKSQMKISKLGQKVYEYNYAASGVDRYNRPLRHGNQKKWNRFGKLIEDFNYSLGRKHGRQWAFDGDNCIVVSEYVNGICASG
jgi:antitoxin component YwqK of YwqJK toxin-antitoxin module